MRRGRATRFRRSSGRSTSWSAASRCANGSSVWPQKPASTFPSPTAGCWPSCAEIPVSTWRSWPPVKRSSLSALSGAVDDLVERGLLTDAAAERAGGGDEGAGGTALSAAAIPTVSLSPSGAIVADQIIDTVRNRLDSLLAGWSPEQYPELARVLDRFASDIVPGTPARAMATAGPVPLDPGN